jgi:hypothetical protein
MQPLWKLGQIARVSFDPKIPLGSKEIKNLEV